MQGDERNNRKKENGEDKGIRVDGGNERRKKQAKEIPNGYKRREVKYFSQRKEVIRVKKDRYTICRSTGGPPLSLSSFLTTAAVINVSLYSAQRTAGYNVLVKRQLILPPTPFKQSIFNLSFHRNRAGDDKTNALCQDA